jgi:hypothetical protein
MGKREGINEKREWKREKWRREKERRKRERKRVTRLTIERNSAKFKVQVILTFFCQLQLSSFAH